MPAGAFYRLPEIDPINNQ
jgi:hypothetical protein